MFISKATLIKISEIEIYVLSHLTNVVVSLMPACRLSFSIHLFIYFSFFVFLIPNCKL